MNLCNAAIPGRALLRHVPITDIFDDPKLRTPPLDLSQRQALLRALDKRYPSLLLQPIICAFLSIIPAVVVVAVIVGLVMRATYDHTPSQATRVFFGVMLLLLCVFPLVVPMIIGLWVRHNLVRNLIGRHLHGQMCFWCGHSLQGLPIEQGQAQCPECGARSPICERQ